MARLTEYAVTYPRSRLRLRNTLVLVSIIACLVILGAWTDGTNVAVADGPRAVPAARPWDAIVEISRHGRRLDGFRPVLTIAGLGDPKSFDGREVASGRYRVQVIFPHAGFYAYTVTVADRVSARGTIYAIPR